MSRRDERRASRTQAVLDAAMELVRADGLEGLTIARLAGRVDAAVGALYRYFPSKEALVVALQTRALAALRLDLEGHAARVEAAARRRRLAPGAASLAAVAAVPLGYLAESRRDPARHRLIAAVLAAPAPVLGEAQALEVEQAVKPILNLAAVRLWAATERGAVEPGEATVRTLVLWAGVQGLTLFTHRDRLQPPPRRVRALAGELLVALLRGWGADLRAARAGVAVATRALEGRLTPSAPP
ncbi:MAG: helix-turn-helix transcriptional regulator [Planctomycetes bacterium]|nr:helix-turn-helix transcriptional regulator [Planctomycetota bacterium]